MVRLSVTLIQCKGTPITTKDGYHIGTVCVVDTKPRVFTEDQVFKTIE